MNSNGFIRKKVDTLTLGETMKKLRQEMHLSLSDISKMTRIQLKYLEALESGNYDKLPADVYVRGFLRTFASVAGVAEKTLIKLYDREKGIQENLNPAKTNSIAKPLEISKFVITPKMIVITASALLCLGAFFYIYQELNSFVSVPRLIIMEPINGKAVSERSINVVGKTDPGSSVEINGQKVMVDENGEFREAVGLQAGMNVISVIARNKFDKEAVQKVSLNAEFDEAVDVTLPSAEMINNQGRTMKLEIWTQNNPTWISIEADGNLIYSGTPTVGEPQTFEAANKIVVSSDYGNNARIKMNGSDLGTLGDDSKPVRGKVFEIKNDNN